MEDGRFEWSCFAAHQVAEREDDPFLRSVLRAFRVLHLSDDTPAELRALHLGG